MTCRENVELDELFLQFKDRKIKAKDIFNIYQISKYMAYSFVRKYHYLGSAKFFAKYSYGLFCKNELCGVATYSSPQGTESLHGWFGVTNDDPTILELSRLCMLPTLNGTNATSFLLGGSIRFLKKEGIRAIITLATSDRHIGSIYQVCNFKYYGLTSPKCDFWAYETQSKPRGIVRNLMGVWVKKPQKHRYAYIIDKRLKCLYDEQKRPTKEEKTEYSCCGGTGRVYDNRYGVWYTCPICTSKLYKIISVDGKEIQVPPNNYLLESQQISFDFLTEKI